MGTRVTVALAALFLSAAFPVPSIVAQEIQSTTIGGTWSDPMTWVGHVPPGAANDVVINGPVSTSAAQSCANLRIAGQGLLYATNAYALVISGNVTNNGAMTGGLEVSIAGDVVNNGTWSPGVTHLSGRADQRLSLGAGRVFGGGFTTVDTASRLVAQSPLHFMAGFEFRTRRLDMAGFSLVLEMGPAEAILSNVPDLELRNGAYLGNGGCIGGTRLHGSARVVAPVTFEGDLAIDGTLYGTDSYPVQVNGSVTNTGTVRGGIEVRVTGDITNSGTWTPTTTRLTGHAEQHLSLGPGQAFGGGFKTTDTVTAIVARTPLRFVTGFELGARRLDMGGFALTVESGPVEGNLANVPDLTLLSGAYLGPGTCTGGIRLHGSARVVADRTFDGDLTIEDSVNTTSNYTLLVTGNLVNNGAVTNGLEMRVGGDIACNGTWNPTSTRLLGGKEQHLSLGAGRTFGGGFVSLDTAGAITAQSALHFLAGFEFGGRRLEMSGYPLTVEAGPADAVIENAPDLTITNGAYLANGTCVGALRLHGPARLVASRTFIGNLTVEDSMFSTSDYSVIVTGSMVNKGRVTGGLQMRVMGDLINNGIWNPVMTHLMSNVQLARVSGIFSSPVYVLQGRYEISGTLMTSPLLSLDGLAAVTISKGGRLLCRGQLLNPGGRIGNSGVFSADYYVAQGDVVPLDPGMSLEMRITRLLNADTVAVLTSSETSHPRVPSSVSRWWRLSSRRPVGDYSLVLHYEDGLLNGNQENKLEVYLSPDNGITWKRISTPANKWLNPAENTITLGSPELPITQGFGDIILSSDTLAAVSSIGVTLTGRTDIRVGPANRYAAAYRNGGSVPTDKFFVALEAQGGVQIRGVAVNSRNSAQQAVIGADSLSWDSTGTQALLLVDGLGSGEVRNIGMLLTAAAEGAGNPQVAITGIWKGSQLTAQYIADQLVDVWPLLWQTGPLDAGTAMAIKDAARAQLCSINDDLGLGEVPAKMAAQSIVDAVARRLGRALPAQNSARVWAALSAIVQAMRDPAVGNSSQSVLSLHKVQAWDPIVLSGPAGYGARAFTQAAKRLVYTVQFENRKDATAPVGTVVIHDTLSTDSFAVDSVRTEGQSHPTVNFSRAGNVLTWEFPGINLPPNAVPPQGEGWISFSVPARAGAKTGAAVTDRAVVLLDANPTVTNQVFNTLDCDPPLSTLRSVTVQSAGTQAALRWTAADGQGSGVRRSYIFAATNDGPYACVAISDSGSAVLPIALNTGYKFYVLSEDNVGNLETTPHNIADLTTGIQAADGLPTVYRLVQSYPNPFNPDCTIGYDLPAASSVVLKIYDMLGREVLTLVNEVQPAGRRAVRWNATNGAGVRVASGVYFYRLSASAVSGPGKTFVDTRKMIHLR